MNAANNHALRRVRKPFLACIAISILAGELKRAATCAAESPTQLQTVVGERVPSEDPLIPNLHSMGLLRGHTNIFRSACPVRDLAKSTIQSDEQKLTEAEARLHHLRELGIRTIFSLEDPEKFNADSYPAASDRSTNRDGKAKIKPTVTLEREAAEKAGIQYISLPMRNSGDDSLQDTEIGAFEKLLSANSETILTSAEKGGVLFHCSAGHDRTGILAAYMRIKYQHWPVDEAIAEMRRYGHNWPKYSLDGGKTSWHEERLRSIASH
jgi:protein tyrosine/serine phosphatase